MPWQARRMLRFHAGQMQAWAGETTAAIGHFRQSYDSAAEDQEAPLRWNAYVRATIAFLQNDLATLQACRKAMQSGPQDPKWVGPNRRIVDRLIAGLGKLTYREAYSPPQVDRFQRRMPMNSTRSLVDPVTDQVIHLTALVPVRPARAFEYFTKAALLTEWLTAAAEIAPEVGGRFELFWEPGDRANNSTIGCRITAQQEGQLIAFQWRSPKQFKNFANGADPLTHVVVSFFPEGSGTRIHLIHTGWRSGPEWEEARMWQKQAWSGAIAELERTATP